MFGAAFGAALFASATASAAQCAARNKVLDMLRDKYSEAPVAFGVTSGGGLLEVLSSKDGATWTVLVTTPKGMTCMTAAGEGWHARDRPVEGPET